MALWHRQYDLLLAPVTPTAAPPVETLYNSDAFPRWTKGAPFTLPAVTEAYRPGTEPGQNRNLGLQREPSDDEMPIASTGGLEGGEVGRRVGVS